MNRLKLDWALSTSTERTNFVQSYLNTLSSPTEEELETIANYILWGKNENDKNIDQEGFVELPRKNSTWNVQNVESLDALSESPTFNEASIYPINSRAPLKKSRKVFSREETRKLCPPYLLSTYETLWKEIDKTELTINYYELLHEKRTKEPRTELLNLLTEEERVECADRAKNLNQFKYLKLRHLLVALRQEQYTLKDSFSEKIFMHSAPLIIEEETNLSFDADILVYPLGLFTDSLIFQPFEKLIPSNFDKVELKQISDFYWSKKSNKFLDARSIDFQDLETVYELLLLLMELNDEVKNNDLFSTTASLLKTLNYYIEQADLTPIQREILDFKIKKEKNQDIASFINRKYGKSYTANYISTIFRQKIIPQINAAARYHEQIISNLFFKEEFKQCTKCGKILLRDPINFVRKSRSRDGLSNHCKDCDKKDREEKKLKEVEKRNG